MLSNVKLFDVSVESTMLLRLLRNSPLLESFIANAVKINEDLNPVIHALSASLPRLRTFELQTAVQSSSATVLHNQLIAHLIFPDTANVSIQYSDSITSISDLNLLLFFMQTVPHDIRWSLKLHGAMFDFQILPSAVHTQYGRRVITIRAFSWERLVLILRDRSEVLSEHLGQRISKLHIGLTMKLQGPQDVTALAELYAILTSVRSIHTSDGSSAGGCLALAGNDTTNSEFPCPNLRRLRLGRELQHFEHYNEYTQQYELRFLNAQSIVEWLGPRVRAGMGPSALRLDSIKQNSDAAVDPALVALIPDTRYVKDNDPDSDDEYM
ncbi:hypothetical protein PENSPDRAFT_691897 [Peniophora sp. CONT]|nr:hypothetical protein PENSPDRAFT_691897 [Peniophora sp. CONT]